MQIRWLLDRIEIGCFRFRQFNAEVGQARLRSSRAMTLIAEQNLLRTGHLERGQNARILSNY